MSNHTADSQDTDKPKQSNATKSLPSIRYRKATRERLIELLERIGWSVRNASTDGTWKRIHLPNGEFSGYWIFGDYDTRIEHRLDDFRGGLTFCLKDTVFELMNGDTVCVSGKNDKSLFIFFHSFNTKKEVTT